MAKTVEAIIWRKAGTTNSWDVDFILRPDQAQAPDTAGTQSEKGISKASIATKAQEWRDKGYGIEWQLGGFVE